jgi:hypothetical protein
MIKDSAIAWKTKRQFIPARIMAGVLDDGTSGVPAALGAGGAIFAEVLAAAELAGMQVGAAGDEVYDFWPFPWDFDKDHPLRFRYWFVHTATDADEPVFKTIYKAIGKQAAISDAGSSPDETVTHGAHTCSTTANALEITAWKKSVSDTKIASTDKALLLCHECDNLGSASANEIVLLGVEIEYTIKATSDDNLRELTDNAPLT